MEFNLETMIPVVMVVLVFTILFINDRQKKRLVERAEREGRSTEKQAGSRGTLWWVAAVVVLGLLFCFDQRLGPPGRPPPGPPQQQGAPVSVYFLFGSFALAVVAIGMLFLFMRWKYRVQLRVARQLHQGDAAGAASVVEEELHRRGPSVELHNLLAVVRIEEKRFEEALRELDAAEQVGGGRPETVNNRGYALWKLGRLDEARGFMEAALRAQPENLVIVCNYGCVLADLGRKDEAREILRKAEDLLKTHKVPGEAQAVLAKGVEALRKAVDGL